MPEYAAPIGAAFFLAIGVMLVSNSVAGNMKLPFQFAVFGTGMSLSFARLMFGNNLGPLYDKFVALSTSDQFCLALVTIGATYFGCLFYLAAPTSAAPTMVMDMPASSDNSVSFSVPKKVPSEDKALFENVFDTICKEIVEDLSPVYEMPDEAIQYVDRMLQYTVAGGKMNRGLACMSVQSTMAQWKGRKMSNRERVQSAALGWCIEFLQAFFLVADDIMDGSQTRRGQPCWYLKEDVKMVAINDSFILESCVFKILKRYCGTEPYYLQLLDLFIEVTRQTELGQLLDLTSTPVGQKVDLSRFSMERLTMIFKYKTAFYSFYLPVALGMIVSGVTDRKMYDKAREILCKMGEYFQIQDDFLDCFGTPEQIGKIGTDIQDSKNSWLVVTALQICNSRQRKVLEDKYGSHDMKKVERVKKLYRELDLKSIFETYEEESYVEIKRKIDEYKELPTEVFMFLLGKIYKRQK